LSAGWLTDMVLAAALLHKAKPNLGHPTPACVAASMQFSAITEWARCPFLTKMTEGPLHCARCRYKRTAAEIRSVPLTGLNKELARTLDRLGRKAVKLPFW